MEILDTAKKTVKIQMLCVLWTKGLENGHTCWCGMERIGAREGVVGGWRY